MEKTWGWNHTRSKAINLPREDPTARSGTVSGIDERFNGSNKEITVGVPQFIGSKLCRALIGIVDSHNDDFFYPVLLY